MGRGGSNTDRLYERLVVSKLSDIRGTNRGSNRLKSGLIIRASELDRYISEHPDRLNEFFLLHLS